MPFHQLSILFQSALPMRGATNGWTTGAARMRYFNPRSPCGERRCGPGRCGEAALISIRAPHAGSDFQRPCGCSRWSYFNPRSPCGERLLRFVGYNRHCYFNPRSPCGERLVVVPVWGFHVEISIRAPHAGSDYYLANSPRLGGIFQSALPMRGATRF